MTTCDRCKSETLATIMSYFNTDVICLDCCDLEKAHEEGCARVKERAMAPVPGRFDVVVTTNSGFPLDQNLYQSVKGMSAAGQVVKDGGHIVIATACSDGLPDHGPYGSLLKSVSSMEDLLAKIRAPGFTEGDMWQVQVQALVANRATVHVYSEGLSHAQIRDALLQPCDDVEATVQDLLQASGPDATLCILPEGPLTIPYISAP